MSAKPLTVVIPTHDRCDILEKTLRAFERQSALDGIHEVLVVDDGSTDDTPAAVALISRASRLHIRYLRQVRAGLGAARNHGLREATTDIILFIDDDVIPRANLAAEHLAWHRMHGDPSVAVMGTVVWSSALHPTPFMQWFGRRGPLLNYAGLRSGAEVELNRSCFGNTSVKARFLRQHGIFDEDIRTYGFEDTELAFRLRRNGWRLLYNPDAVGDHHKFVTFAAACERAKLTALTFRTLETKEYGRYLKGLRDRQKKSLRYRAGTLLVRTLVPVFSPLKPLLNSRVPLPWPVYAAFYHYYKFR